MLSVRTWRRSSVAWRSQRHPDRRLRTRGGAARQQQIGDVGARNQQHQSRDDAEQPQAGGRIALEGAHATAGRREMNLLFADLGAVMGRQIRIRAEVPLQLRRNLRLDACRMGFRFQPPDDIEPMGAATQQGVRRSVKRRLGPQGQPEVRRIGAQTVPEESRRRNAGNRVRHLVDRQRGANDRGIQPKVLLPGAIAHHGHGRRTRLVVGGRNRASREYAHPERCEIIARDEFTRKRLGRCVCAATAYAQAGIPALESGHLAELGRPIAKLLI